jgi:hypothetical protein
MVSIAVMGEMNIRETEVKDYKYVHVDAATCNSNLKRIIVELILYEIRKDFLLIKLASLTVHCLSVMSMAGRGKK